MIWLVGAGPGDSGLLTLRGYEVLKREDAERIDAGKSSGSHTMTLHIEEISGLRHEAQELGQRLAEVIMQ